MKTHLVHKFLILRMQEFYFCGGRVSAEGKPARDRTKILTDSARKKKAGKKFWRIIIKQKLTQATIFTVGWN